MTINRQASIESAQVSEAATAAAVKQMAQVADPLLCSRQSDLIDGQAFKDLEKYEKTP